MALSVSALRRVNRRKRVRALHDQARAIHRARRIGSSVTVAVNGVHLDEMKMKRVTSKTENKNDDAKVLQAFGLTGPGEPVKPKRCPACMVLSARRRAPTMGGTMYRSVNLKTYARRRR